MKKGINLLIMMASIIFVASCGKENKANQERQTSTDQTTRPSNSPPKRPGISGSPFSTNYKPANSVPTVNSFDTIKNSVKKGNFVRPTGPMNTFFYYRVNFDCTAYKNIRRQVSLVQFLTDQRLTEGESNCFDNGSCVRSLNKSGAKFEMLHDMVDTHNEVDLQKKLYELVDKGASDLVSYNNFYVQFKNGKSSYEYNFQMPMAANPVAKVVELGPYQCVGYIYNVDKIMMWGSY